MRMEKYLEILVGKVAGGYSKGSTLKFERYLDGIDLAIRQANMFEEDEERLKRESGNQYGKTAHRNEEGLIFLTA